MAFTLKQISPTVYAIRAGGNKIGSVIKKHDGSGFYGRMQAGKDTVESTQATAADAFRDLATQANRISLCGRNDHDAAVKALNERNARVEAEAARIAADPATQATNEAFRDIAREIANVLKIELPPARRRSMIRRRRISI